MTSRLVLPSRRKHLVSRTEKHAEPARERFHTALGSSRGRTLSRPARQIKMDSWSEKQTGALKQTESRDSQRGGSKLPRCHFKSSGRSQTQSRLSFKVSTARVETRASSLALQEQRQAPLNAQLERRQQRERGEKKRR